MNRVMKNIGFFVFKQIFVLLLIFILMFFSTIEAKAESTTSGTSEVIEYAKPEGQASRRHRMRAEINAAKKAQAEADKKKTAYQKKVIAGFFDRLQKDTITNYKNEIDELNSLKSCLQNRGKQCPEWPMIQKSWAIYRHYVGITNGHSLRKNFRRTHIPIFAQRVDSAKGAKQMLYQWGDRNPEGTQELVNINAEIDAFERQTDKDMGGRLLSTPYFQHLSSADQKYYRLQIRSMRHKYKAFISDILIKHPYFGFLDERVLTIADMIAAIDQAIAARQNILDDVTQLKGEARYELMGFLPVLATTMASYSQAQSEEIAKVFSEVQDAKTMWQRVKEVLNNNQTRAMIACHSFVAAAPVLGIAKHPLVKAGLLGLSSACTSYGVVVASIGAYGMTKDMLRQMEYLDTHQFDEQMYHDLMMSYMISMTMTYIWLRPAIPGVATRVTGVKFKDGKKLLTRDSMAVQWALYRRTLAEKAGKTSRDSLAGIKDEITQPMIDREMKRFAEAELQLFQSYASYYAKDIVARGKLLKPKIIKELVNIAYETIPFYIADDDFNEEFNVFSYAKMMEMARERLLLRIQEERAKSEDAK